MTTEKTAAAEEAKSEKATSAQPSDKSENAGAKAGDVREEQDRRTVIWGSLLFLLFAAPVFLPVDDERSLWRMTRHDSTGRIILLTMLGWPVFMGIVGALRGFRRNVPKKAFLIITTIMTCLFTLAAFALMTMVMLYEREATESPLFWGAVLAVSLAMTTFVRSFFRQGWQRYQHLLAVFALHASMLVLMFAGAEPNGFKRLALGARVFLFATAALVPFALSTLFSRRKA